VIDATDWYIYFAMIALPLNSVINPLIYDNKLRGLIVEMFQFVANSITNSSVYASIRGIWKSREENRTREGMEMVQVQNVQRLQQIRNVIEPAEPAEDEK
jgi:hypothetical protein